MYGKNLKNGKEKIMTVKELNQEEMKEIDQLVSYQYNSKDDAEEV